MNVVEEVGKIFRREPSAKVVWQPRIEHWFKINKRRNTLPEQFRDAELIDVYKALDSSVRYLSAWSPVRQVDPPEVKQETVHTDGRMIHTTRTPIGEIQRVDRETSDSWMVEKFPVETPDDLRVAQYIVESMHYEPYTGPYLEEAALLGERYIPTAVVPRVNIMRVFLDYMGFENGIYALHDSHGELKTFCKALDASDLRYCRALLETPAKFINYGDNIHCDMLPPPLLKEFVLPAYHQRNEILHPAGRYTFSHWDGNVKTILPYARETGLDGIEAITFEPMGDATFEMVAECMGDDVVLVDGICATSFLPYISMQEFEDEVYQVIERLHPRLILGVSDEPPPDAEYRKLERVTEIVAEYNRE